MIDAQARANTANAPYNNKQFAPREFAADYCIDLTQLGKNENKRPPLLRAPLGTNERTYQDANAAFGLPEFQALMAIPERRKTPRPAESGASNFGQFQSSGADDKLSGGAKSDFLSVVPENSPQLPARPKPAVSR